MDRDCKKNPATHLRGLRVGRPGGSGFVGFSYKIHAVPEMHDIYVLVNSATEAKASDRGYCRHFH